MSGNPQMATHISLYTEHMARRIHFIRQQGISTRIPIYSSTTAQVGAYPKCSMLVFRDAENRGRSGEMGNS